MLTLHRPSILPPQCFQVTSLLAYLDHMINGRDVGSEDNEENRYLKKTNKEACVRDKGEMY